MTKQRFVWLGLMLVCAAATSLHAQQFYFQTFAIPQSTVSLGVQGLNDFGTTSGSLVDSSSNYKAWVRDPHGDVNIFVNPRNTSMPSYTVADHINDLGVVVGEYFDTANGAYEGFFAFAGKFQSYVASGALPGATTSVDGVNNFGGFCGFTGNPPFTQFNAYVSINGKPTIFTVNASTDAFCQDINDLGWAVGAYFDGAGLAHGWIRNPFNGTITTYDAPGASTSNGTPENNPCKFGSAGGTLLYGINDRGDIAGHFWDASFNEHGFVVSPGGKFTQIDVPGAAATSLGALNNLGQTAGHYTDGSCNNRGYIGTPKYDDDDDK